jgi:hypothetical protein
MWVPRHWLGRASEPLKIKLYTYEKNYTIDGFGFTTFYRRM